MFLENYYLESVFTGYYPKVADLLTILSIISAILVIITKNPVISVLYLILLFIVIGCYLMLLGMYFLGLSYLLVYIGAIAILFLFIIMLLDIKSSELININKNSNVLGFLITLIFFYSIFSLIPNNNYNSYNIISNIFHSITSFTSGWSYFTNQMNESFDPSKDTILAIYNINWETSINSYTHLSIIGNIMYNNYVIWLFLTGFILLLALIGSIILISTEKKS